ncbi:MAG: beta-ketoacyl-[acyl-carrier-protein] synthase family protein, partial [Chloroflexota bacterium]
MNRQESKVSDQRVVITGVGVASSVGHTLDAYCDHLFAGQYGIRPIVDVDQTFLKHGIGGQIIDFPEPDWKARLDEKNSSQLTAITLYCAQQAVQESRLTFDPQQSKRYGAVVGSGFHNLYDLEGVYRDYYRHSKKLGTMTIPRNMSSAPASRIAMYYGLHGHISTVSSACSSGFTALLKAVEQLRSGRHDVVISGGTDLMISETLLLSWERMRVLSRTDDPEAACRPFSQGREGIAIGDGCALFVLESLEHAQARGAHILAEISGIFQNSDSLDLVKPNAAGEINCMRSALDDAELEPEAIDLIFAHATGT